MRCRITDEHVYNPWDDIDIEDIRTHHLKSIRDVTLNDLMSTNTYPWVARTKCNHGHLNQDTYILELENDEQVQPFLVETGLHPAAMESLADFCRRYLGFYEKLGEQGGE